MAPASSTSSSRRLLAVAAFVALVIAGDQLLGRGLLAVVDASQFRFSRLYRGGVDADILIVGNSRAVAALPPPVIAGATGRQVFSIAYNGLDPESSLALVADYLDRNRRPELIVVEASSVVQPVGVIPDLKLYAGQSPRLRALFARRSPAIGLVARSSLLFRANAEFLLRALYYRDRSDQGWMNRGRISADERAALIEADATPLETTPEHLEALRELVALGRDSGVEVRLMIAPYLPATRDKLGVDRWVAALQAALAPIEVADYSRALESVELFADRIHPNELGARALIAKLRAAGFFRLD